MKTSCNIIHSNIHSYMYMKILPHEKEFFSSFSKDIGVSKVVLALVF